MAGSTEILATHCFDGDVDAVLKFLKRTRDELRELRMVRVQADGLEVIDINFDAFEIRGLGYEKCEIVPVLDAVNTAFNRSTIHAPTKQAYKEFKTGRRRPWAEDRVM
ncbi:MAG: hypothetical protein ACR2NM_00825 [Bythopirellula sp.]